MMTLYLKKILLKISKLKFEIKNRMYSFKKPLNLKIYYI